MRGRLAPEQVAEVRRLVERATDVDGVHPLSEHVTLHLEHGGDEPARNLLVRAGDRLAGYAHLDPTDVVEGSSAELVVDPELRRHGLARQLVTALLDLSPDGRLRLWAHGSHPGAGALAAALGFRRTRVLLQLRRSLFAALPAPGFPPDVAVRTFVPGQDEQPWVALNNRAFAGHPEQGGWTVDDLRLREAESWFDPAGFFLAERGDELVGFHWTKVHGRVHHEGDRSHDHDPIGEVYVVGVDPGEHRNGLGRALTLHGLRHLRARGLAQVMLYVDEANVPAIRLYESLGFTRWDVDVCYRRP